MGVSPISPATRSRPHSSVSRGLMVACEPTDLGANSSFFGLPGLFRRHARWVLTVMSERQRLLRSRCSND